MGKLMAWSRGMIAAGLAAFGMANTASAQTLLTEGARYPRIIALSDGELIASTLTVPNVFNVKIFSSKDGGATFSHIGTVEDPEFAPTRTSSPDLFELPGGALILALNVDTQRCPTCRSKIKLYRSTDKGRSWAYLSTPVTSSGPKGFWEPDFSIARDGALVMHYADESSSCCSQKLVRIRSYDGGATWKDRTNTIAMMSHPYLRPGMPMVSRMKDGNWLMTYEVCGQAKAINCESRYKVSADGWDYGDTATIGEKMADRSGRYMLGTPVHAVAPDGAILWMGKELREADGSLSDRNGMVIFKSASGSPKGPWTTVPAPVTRPNAVIGDNCDGFSPGLTALAGGKVAMVSARLEGRNCRMYVGVGSAK